MSSTGVTEAKAPQKQEQTNREDTNVIVFVNVIFSLLCSENAKKKCSDEQQQSCKFALAEVVKEHVCYRSNIKEAGIPDKLYAYECEILCTDLYFDENGNCIDILGEYEKIITACETVETYLSGLTFPEGTKIQVCLNIMGVEPLPDVAWGFAFMADACCSNNIEDDELNDMIMENYEPFFMGYIEKGWSVRVTYIALMEVGLIFEAKNTEGNNKAIPVVQKRNPPQEVTNGKSKEIPIEKPIEKPIGTDTSTLVLTGHVEKNVVNISSFISFDCILDCIPPFNTIRLIDRLMGVDKIEEEIKASAFKSVASYIRGDNENGWKYLKEAGGASLDYVHKRLELISFVPGPGTIAGVADGLIYTFQEGFAWGDQEKMEELRERALLSYFFAIPFTKIVKYAAPTIKSAVAIGKMGKSAKALSAADKAVKEATIAKKAVKGAPKKVRKKASSARYKEKQKRRLTENAIAKERNNPESIQALEKYGMTYDEAISRTRFQLVRDTFNIWDKNNTPVGDVFQAGLSQIVNPYSSTNEKINDWRRTRK